MIALCGAVCLPLVGSTRPPTESAGPVEFLAFSFILAVVVGWRYLHDPLTYILVISCAALPSALLSLYNDALTDGWSCVTCYLPHVALLACFSTAATSRRDTREAFVTLLRTDRDKLGTPLLVTGLTLVAVLAAFGAVMETDVRLAHWARAQPRLALPQLAATAGHRVTVAVFTDYQCPYCKKRHAEYDGLVRAIATAHPGQVQAETFDFPLSTECNHSVAATIHDAACAAAVAVRLAAEAGPTAGEAAADYFFQHQDNLSIGMARTYATGVGLDFDGRYKAVIGAIGDDVRLATLAHVHGTPAYFVNGIRVINWTPAELRAVILEELR